MKYKYWLDNTGLSNGKKNLLLEYFQTAEEVYRGTEETYQKIPQLKEEEIQRITKAKRKWDINEEYQKLEEGGVSVTFACDKNYPKKLKNIYQPPFALYYSGKLPGERLSVAIVGARRCSEYGHYMARKLGEALGRNRIPVISGLAEVVVIAEAKKKSGSLITAEHALEQGKDIYVFPGRTTDALSYGCNALIQQGAGIILSVEEFLKQLPYNATQSLQMGKNKKQCLAKEESLVYSCLSMEPKNIEKIAEETGLGISATAGILLGLLAKGLVFESFRNYYIEE